MTLGITHDTPETGEASKHQKEEHLANGCYDQWLYPKAYEQPSPIMKTGG